MNPKGLKPTVTGSFPKEGEEIDFLSHNVLLYRSPKPYDANVLQFWVDPMMSKPEIKQYLMKVYGLNVQKVHTVNKKGRIVRRQDNTKFRKKDWKKAIAYVDFEVDPGLSKTP